MNEINSIIYGDDLLTDKERRKHKELEPIIKEAREINKGVRAENKTYFDFYDNIYIINERINYIITFNFGFDQNASNFKVFCKLSNMTDKDKSNFIWLCEKYRFEVNYTPYQMFDIFKARIMNDFDKLVYNVVLANSIYPTNELELNRKRQFINEAMATCHLMIQHLEMADQTFKFDHEKLLCITQPIFSEIEVLKNWKRSTKTQYDIIQNQIRIDTIHKNSLCPIYMKNNDGSYDFCGNYHTHKATINEVIEMKQKVEEDLNNKKQYTI